MRVWGVSCLRRFCYALSEWIYRFMISTSLTSHALHYTRLSLTRTRSIGNLFDVLYMFPLYHFSLLLYIFKQQRRVHCTGTTRAHRPHAHMRIIMFKFYLCFNFQFLFHLSDIVSRILNPIRLCLWMPLIHTVTQMLSHAVCLCVSVCTNKIILNDFMSIRCSSASRERNVEKIYHRHI